MSRSEWGWKRRKLAPLIKERDGYRCTNCGVVEDLDAGVRLEIDHIIAIKYGGTNDLENLQTFCHPCNLRKGPVKG